MSRPRTLELTEEQKAELVYIRDHDVHAYMRERVTALLKIHDGMSLLEVARSGLLRKRDPSTVREWVVRFEKGGVAALRIRPGRGRKPAYSPQHPDAASAGAELEEVIHHSPRTYGLPASRWTLEGLRKVVPWLANLSLPGIYKVLRRLRIHYKRGRAYLHSPDPDYDAKMERVKDSIDEAEADPEHVVVLYEDEKTYYRRPMVGYSYARAGSDEPHAKQGLAYNSHYRIAGSLDIHTGSFWSSQRPQFDRYALVEYYLQLEQHYPEATRIYIVQDNWPVHFHPDVLEALKDTKIELLRLPTYAPWTNPVEKVWRKLSQEVLNLHEFIDDWAALKSEVAKFLDSLTDGSRALLHYVGLLPD